MTMPSGLGWTAGHLALAHPLATCAVCLCAAGGYISHTSDVSTPTIVLTLDDATVSQFTLALPMTEKFDIDGTLYVPSSLVLEEGDERGWYMTAADVRSFRDAGWEIGAHTTLHENMLELAKEVSVNAVLDTMELSNAQVRGMINETGNLTFAYPFGESDAVTQALATSVFDYSVNAWSDAMGVNIPATFEPHNIHRLDVGSAEAVTLACETAAMLEDGQTFVVIVHDVVLENPGDYELDVEQFEQLLTCFADLRDSEDVVLKSLREAAKHLSILSEGGIIPASLVAAVSE